MGGKKCASTMTAVREVQAAWLSCLNRSTIESSRTTLPFRAAPYSDGPGGRAESLFMDVDDISRVRFPNPEVWNLLDLCHQWTIDPAGPKSSAVAIWHTLLRRVARSLARGDDNHVDTDILSDFCSAV